MRSAFWEICVLAAVVSATRALPARAEGAATEACAAIVKTYEALKAHGDPDQAQLTLAQRTKKKVEAFAGIAKSLEISDGDLERLVSNSGAKYTAEDLEILRKYTRLVDVINQYAEMRIYLSALSEDNLAAYEELNKAMAQDKATLGFASGKSNSRYLATVQKAKAKELNLALNDVVFEANARMGEALEKCRELGGKVVAGKYEPGLLANWREDLATDQMLHKKYVEELKIDKPKVDKLQLKISQAGSDAKEQAARDELRALQRKMLEDNGRRLLYEKRASDLSKKIEQGSADFAASYDLLDLSSTMPEGKLNSDRIPKVELPYMQDAAGNKISLYQPSAEDKAAWQTVFKYENEYSATERVRRELNLAVDVRKRNLKRLIQAVNSLTGKVYGVKFTETAIGKQWAEYANGWIKEAQTTAKKHWISLLVGTSSSVVIGLVKYEIGKISDDKIKEDKAKGDSGDSKDLKGKKAPAGGDKDSDDDSDDDDATPKRSVKPGPGKKAPVDQPGADAEK
ncbi:MAG: hypothetical protein ACXWP5_08800 [Bdellovibrionota bacterium]